MESVRLFLASLIISLVSFLFTSKKSCIISSIIDNSLLSILLSASAIDNNKHVDVLTLGMHDKYIGVVNQSNKINCFSSLNREPWQYYTEQAVFKKTAVNNKNIDKEYMQELIIILSCYNLVVYLLNERNLVPSDIDFVDGTNHI